MSSVFTEMLNGDRPCHKIAEDARFAAVLEPRPLAEGHVIVFPKRETDALFDLDDTTLGELFVFAKPVAAAIRRAFPCEKVAVLVVGLKVRHAHVHLVPVSGRPGELDFANAREMPESAMIAAAGRVRSFL